MPEYDVEALVQRYSLPALPDETEADLEGYFAPGTEPRVLILFRYDETNIVLTGPVSFADADEYTNREDTHGDGWFVGRDRWSTVSEPGEIY